MAAPIINMVTTSSTTSPPTYWNPVTLNWEVTTTTKLDFGTLNIDANAWSAVKVVWAYVVDMGVGNSSIASMGFYVDGTLVSGMTHYDSIETTWVNPATHANLTGASGLTSGTSHQVLESDGTNTMEAATDHSQYIYVQYYVLSSVSTGSKSTGAGTGRPTFAYTYS